MRLKDNPFNVLGVTPEDDISTIAEAAEDKAFMDDDNAAKYEAARLILTSPQKRFDAEVCWFYGAKNLKAFMGVSADTAENEYAYREAGLYFCEKLYEPHSNEEYAYYIEQIDYQFGESDYFEDDTFNDARNKAGISPISEDEDILVDRMKDILLGQAQDAFRAMIANVSTKNLVIIANIVASKTIEEKINGDGSYYDSMEKFIELYTVAVKEYLAESAATANRYIEAAKNANTVSQLQEMFTKVREFDYIAQPIQLYLQDTGNSEKQEESVDVAYTLRDLALYLHNEKDKTELSIAVIDLLKEKFSELPAIRDIALKDKETLTDLNETKYVQEGIDPIIEGIKNNIEKKVESWQSNARYVERNANTWNSTLNNIGARIARNGYNENACDMLAVAYIVIAEAYAFAAKFRLAVQILDKGKPWAQRGSNQDIIDRINNDRRQYQDLFEYDRSQSSTTQNTSYSNQSSGQRTTPTNTTRPTYTPPSQNSSSDNDGPGCLPFMIMGGIGLCIGGPFGAIIGCGLAYLFTKK